ncbi:MAG: hypothetical protein QME96_14575, partial [Myxococcota bacterium]|nr:hypothetical protein [Myxococcota bacterium]
NAGLDRVPAESGLLRLETLVSLASRRGALPGAATVRLPVVSFAQTCGAYVNRSGRVQRFGRAIPPCPEVLEVPEALARLARRMDLAMPFSTAAEASAALAAREPAFDPDRSGPGGEARDARRVPAGEAVR